MWLIVAGVLTIGGVYLVKGTAMQYLRDNRERLLISLIKRIPWKEQIIQAVQGASQAPPSTEYFGNSIRIGYERFGRPLSVYLPYKRHLIPSMSTSRVYAQYDDRRMEITQQNGIPYMVSAKDLGANSLVLVDLNGQESVLDPHTLPNFEIP